MAMNDIEDIQEESEHLLSEYLSELSEIEEYQDRVERRFQEGAFTRQEKARIDKSLQRAMKSSTQWFESEMELLIQRAKATKNATNV